MFIADRNDWRRTPHCGEKGQYNYSRVVVFTNLLLWRLLQICHDGSMSPALFQASIFLQKSYVLSTWRVFQKHIYRPYSEQRHDDRCESEAVRDRLTVFPMASAVKSWIKRLYYLQFSTAYIVGSFLSTDISWKDIFPVFHEQNNPKTH